MKAEAVTILKGIDEQLSKRPRSEREVMELASKLIDLEPERASVAIWALHEKTSDEFVQRLLAYALAKTKLSLQPFHGAHSAV